MNLSSVSYRYSSRSSESANVSLKHFAIVRPKARKARRRRLRSDRLAFALARSMRTASRRVVSEVAKSRLYGSDIGVCHAISSFEDMLMPKDSRVSEQLEMVECSMVTIGRNLFVLVATVDGTEKERQRTFRHRNRLELWLLASFQDLSLEMGHVRTQPLVRFI